MLVNTSGKILDQFYQTKLGASAHYFLDLEKDLVLFDPGSAIKLEFLEKRLADLINRNKPTKLFITNLSPDRSSAVPYLKKKYPDIKLFSTVEINEKIKDENFMKTIFEKNNEINSIYPQIKLENKINFEEYIELFKIDDFIHDKEVIRLSNDLSLQVLQSPGYTDHSISFIINPYGILISDQGLGYFRGKEQPAIGSDFSIEKSIEFIDNLINYEITSLCLPLHGTITGEIADKHLKLYKENFEDLYEECREAIKQDISEDDIKESIKEIFYTSYSSDPIEDFLLNQSFDKAWLQIKEKV